MVCLYSIFLLLNVKTIQWPFGIIDSPIILAQAIQYSPLEYFTSPSKYQFLATSNFTPWVTLSWDFDYALFKLEPLGYRVHQLVAMAALLCIVYMVLYRLTHSILNTSLFCFAFLTLPATFDIVDDPINRHYLEGMIFCLLSVIFADNYNRKKVVVWLALSLLLYAMSITAKEVFIPLPAVLFFLFPGSVRRKILLTLPYALVLLACLIWRFYMLSGAGSYSTFEDYLRVIQNFQVLSAIAQRLLASLFINTFFSLLVLALFALLLAANFLRMGVATRIGLLVSGAGVVSPLLSLLPTMAYGVFSPRWLFAPSIAFLVCLSFLCSITRSRALASMVYVFVLACSVFAFYIRTHEPTSAYVKGGERIYKTILNSDADNFEVRDNYEYWVARGIATWVYVAKLHNGNWGTLLVSDVGQLQYHDTRNKKAKKVVGGKMQAIPASARQTERLDLIKSGRYDTETGYLTLNFADDLNSDHCFVYVFGKHNGLLLEVADCKQFRVSYQELSYQARMTGYALPEMSIAVWTKDPNNRQYSKVYNMRKLLNLKDL